MARIAFLIPNLGGGGAERVALTLTGAFAERGHEVDLLVMQKKGELVELVPSRVRLVDLGAPRTRNVLRPLIRYLRERRPDALQVSMWPLTIVGVLAVRLSGSRAKLVVSDHSVLSSHYPPKTQRSLGLTTRLFYPLADARVVVSRGAGSDLAQLSGLPESRFTVVPNPISLPAIVRSSDAVEALWGDASRRILTVGKLKPEKNQALLIRAFSRLPFDLNARLMIVGSGDLERELKREAISCGVADRVVFAGHVLDPWPCYASADLFVLSSRQESFGNVLVEALHAGVPIVSTDTIGAREVLESGRWGCVVELGDSEALAVAMRQQLNSHSDRAALRHRAEDLSGESAVGSYLDLLLPRETP